jgi:hypothetical protein
MASIWIVLKIVDDRENEFVVRTFTASKNVEFPLQDAKQFFDVAMLLT